MVMILNFGFDDYYPIKFINQPHKEPTVKWCCQELDCEFYKRCHCSPFVVSTGVTIYPDVISGDENVWCSKKSTGENSDTYVRIFLK